MSVTLMRCAHGAYANECTTCAEERGYQRAIDAVIQRFSGPLSWCCLDHGGEEQELIVARVRALTSAPTFTKMVAAVERDVPLDASVLASRDWARSDKNDYRCIHCGAYFPKQPRCPRCGA